MNKPRELWDEWDEARDRADTLRRVALDFRHARNLSAAMELEEKADEIEAEALKRGSDGDEDRASGWADVFEGRVDYYGSL